MVYEDFESFVPRVVQDFITIARCEKSEYLMIESSIIGIIVWYYDVKLFSQVMVLSLTTLFSCIQQCS